MPISNGRPKDRQPKKHRLFLNTQASTGFVTTNPDRRDKDGKRERIPGLSVTPLNWKRPQKIRRGEQVAA